MSDICKQLNQWSVESRNRVINASLSYIKMKAMGLDAETELVKLACANEAYKQTARACGFVTAALKESR